MAGEAAAIDNNTGRDYWMGGFRSDEGWQWMSGDPMVYTNWQEHNPDGSKGGPYLTLLKNDFPIYRWAPESPTKNGDNGVICEMKSV